MPWASCRRTPLGHHGFGCGLTHPGARLGNPLGGSAGKAPLADEFSSSQVGSLPYSVTKHAAVALAEWCGVLVGWSGWLESEKSSVFFCETNWDSWDRPVSGLKVFPAKVGKPLGFLDWILNLCMVNWPCDVFFWRSWSHGHMVRLEVLTVAPFFAKVMTIPSIASFSTILKGAVIHINCTTFPPCSCIIFWRKSGNCMRWWRSFPIFSTWMFNWLNHWQKPLLALCGDSWCEKSHSKMPPLPVVSGC